ncbi:MAG: hypothetical protein WAT79_10455 [Saprospiraceae bacterium]
MFTKPLNLLFILTLSVFSLALFSCDKQETEDNKVVISFQSPDENQAITSGDSVFLNATITSELSIHGYEIYIHELVTGETILLSAKHTHDEIISIAESWKVMPKENTNVEIEIVALVDHNGKKVKSKRNIRYQK